MNIVDALLYLQLNMDNRLMWEGLEYRWDNGKLKCSDGVDCQESNNSINLMCDGWKHVKPKPHIWWRRAIKQPYGIHDGCSWKQSKREFMEAYNTMDDGLYGPWESTTFPDFEQDSPNNYPEDT